MPLGNGKRPFTVPSFRSDKDKSLKKVETSRLLFLPVFLYSLIVLLWETSLEEPVSLNDSALLRFLLP